jgi:hypothetical protein
MDIQNTKNLSAIDSAVNLIRTTIIATEPLRVKDDQPANCAVSCLVQPRIGDSVLCAVSNQDQVYVLAVLERLEPQKETVIYSAAPLILQTTNLTVASEEIELMANKVNCNIGSLKRMIEAAEDLVGHYRASFGTFFMFAKRSIRRVEELDETRSGHLKLESPTLVEVSGAVTAISGEELIKMQSKQIHMG